MTATKKKTTVGIRRISKPKPLPTKKNKPTAETARGGTAKIIRRRVPAAIERSRLAEQMDMLLVHQGYPAGMVHLLRVLEVVSCCVENPQNKSAEAAFRIVQQAEKAVGKWIAKYDNTIR
jgi:hypothetical protein